MKSIKIVFKPETELALPVAHFDILQGAFYNLLFSYDYELASAVHDPAYSKEEGKKYKGFCFTDLQGKYQWIDRYKIKLYCDSILWEIRSMEDMIVDAVIGAIKNSPYITMNHAQCAVSCIEESEINIFAECVMFNSTPITMYSTDANGHRHHFKPEEEQFCDMIEKNLLRKYSQYFKTLDLPFIKFKTVSRSPKDKCVTIVDNERVTGYYGLYELTAPPEVIKTAYYAGIGSKNSKGFGTIREIRGVQK